MVVQYLDLDIGCIPGNLALGVNYEIALMATLERVLFHVGEVSRVVVEIIYEIEIIIVEAVG